MRARSGEAGHAASGGLLGCQSDERLVALCRAGHDAAFEAIVRRYRRPLLGYARRLIGDGRAEDAVQQAFLNAYRAIGSSEGELELRPWLYRVAHNATLDVLRRGGLDTVGLSADLDGVERPEEVFEQRERVRDLVAAVQELPQRQRDALVLRELEGRGHEEIALELGVTGGAVRQLIHRARASVRAGVSAVFPLGLVESLGRGSAGESVAGRLPELVAAGATTTTVAKAAVAIIVVGGVAGGGATVSRPNAESVIDRGAPRAAAHAPPTSTSEATGDAVDAAASTRTADAPTSSQRQRKDRRRADARRSRERRAAVTDAATRQPATGSAPGTAPAAPSAQARDVDAPEPVEAEDLEEAEPAEIEAPEPYEADDDDPEDEIDV